MAKKITEAEWQWHIDTVMPAPGDRRQKILDQLLIPAATWLETKCPSKDRQKYRIVLAIVKVDD